MSKKIFQMIFFYWPTDFWYNRWHDSLKFIKYYLFLTGQWLIKDIKANSEGESQKIKVKVRINIHGLFTVASASLYERKDASDPEDPETNGELPENNQQQQPEATTNANATEVSPSWSKRLTKWFTSVRIFLNCLACRSLK